MVITFVPPCAKKNETDSQKYREIKSCFNVAQQYYLGSTPKKRKLDTWYYFKLIKVDKTDESKYNRDLKLES